MDVVNLSLSELATELAAGVFERFTWLSGFIRTVGIFVIIYVVYLLIKAIRDIRTRERIKNINDRVDSIDEKLDKVLGKQEKKVSVVKNVKGSKKGSKK
jgi:hypothetical protein